jgi:predicted transcriptional regulator
MERPDDERGMEQPLGAPGIISAQASDRVVERDLRWRSVLSARTERAEADFEAGRVYTQEQVEAHFKAKRAPKPAP